MSCGQEAEDKEILDVPFTKCILPKHPFHDKTNFVQHPLRPLILLLHQSLKSLHFRKFFKDNWYCPSQSLCNYPLSPVFRSQCIANMCFTPVITRFWLHGNVSNGAVIHTYRLTPWVRNSNLLYIGQSFLTDP